MIRLRCAHCQQRLTIEERHAGRTLKCPACSQPVSVPPATSNVASDSSDSDWPDLDGFLQDEPVGELPAASRPQLAASTLNNPAARAVESAANSSRSTAQICPGCGKTLAAGDRFCIACGFNNYDSAAESVAAQQSLNQRLEQQQGQRFYLRWVRLFTRMFR